MHESISSTLGRRWGTLFISGLVVAVLSAAASLLFPLEFRADAQVLIVSRSRFGVDPYTVVKSAERIGENVVPIVKTNDFYSKVMATPGYAIDKSRFENVPERTKRKRWQKAVTASVVYGTGVLNVSAFSTDQKQAVTLASAAVHALVASAPEYVGGDVSMKIINDPVATRFPVRPNLPVNALVGFVVGGLLAAVRVLRKTR